MVWCVINRRDNFTLLPQDRRYCTVPIPWLYDIQVISHMYTALLPEKCTLSVFFLYLQRKVQLSSLLFSYSFQFVMVMFLLRTALSDINKITCRERITFSSTQFYSKFLFFILFINDIYKHYDAELGGRLLWHVLGSCCSICLEEMRKPRTVPVNVASPHAVFQIQSRDATELQCLIFFTLNTPLR